MKTQTPKGVRDLLPDDVEERGNVVSALRNVFKKHGYRRIITPTFEIYNVLKRGMSPKLQSLSLKFFDHKGDLMVLRPDMTTPIARVIAARMTKEPRPIKLFYSANVYRQQDADAGRDTEFYQAGVECFGESSIASDAAIIALAVESMKALGLKDFMIDVGHMDLVKNLPMEKVRALEEQNYVSFGEIPLRGGPEVVKNHPYFLKLYEELKKHKVEEYIQFNLGLIKEMAYYTGIVFECYVAGVGYYIGGGGRYDSLVGSYGEDCPAVGFAFGVERLLLALEENRKNVNNSRT